MPALEVVSLFSWPAPIDSAIRFILPFRLRRACTRAAAEALQTGSALGVEPDHPSVDSVSYRVHIARVAVDARDAVAACTLLHPGGYCNRVGVSGNSGTVPGCLID